jgi:hypothetical protein
MKRQHGDLISLIFLFTESRLKTENTRTKQHNFRTNKYHDDNEFPTFDAIQTHW